MIKSSGNPRRDFEKATAEILKLQDRILDYKQQISSLRATEQRLHKDNADQKNKYEAALAEKDAIIKELKNLLAHAEALLGHDGTNTGTPTGQTPPGKKKIIPNTRRSSGKPKGGQIGHEKASLKEPDEEDVTETISHPLQEDECCPKCGLADYTPTGESEVKYEYDVRINVVKIKHEFYYYKCNNCGTEFRSQIPPQLKESAQYGSELKAMVLSLANTVNAPMNKVSMFVEGITGGKLTPCEGYVAKLQKCAARKLVQFREDLKRLLITRKIVYWDDTVIMILAERACFRFYGDEAIAYYTAHSHKDMESLDADNVLNLLTAGTKTMHDHNTVNYNEKYCFENIECNQHLQRDCLKNSNDTCHKWSGDLKTLISSTVKDRNDAISRGETSFEQSYILQFYEKLDQCLADGWAENKADSDNYGAGWERTLLKRIAKYRGPYFKWIEDFSLPTTNNLSERGLRGIKSRMKISGQFESEKAADNYALIRSYIETCRRNHINEIDALERLCAGAPYTVAEIFPVSNS